MDVGFDDPLYVEELSEGQRAADVDRSPDFRVLRQGSETHYFVRGVIEIPVTDVDDVFRYGVWSSLSRTSYELAKRAYDANESAGPFFGWLANRIAGYPDTLTLKVSASFRPDLKPRMMLEPMDHPLAIEQSGGITLARVMEIVEPLMHPQ